MASLSRDPTKSYRQLWEQARKARYPFDREAWLNYMFFNGEQYVDWATDTNALRRKPMPQNAPNMPRPTANKIMHFVEQEHSLVLQTRPTVDVLPVSEDPHDISHANVAKAYLDWLSDETQANFNQELAIATKWALSSTEGYLKWMWDPKLKRGTIQACSPFDIYPDPYAKSFDKCRYIFHTQFMDTERVYDIYNKEVQASSLDRADPSKITLQREYGMAPILEGAMVHELWMKPCRRYPDGLFVVWAGKDILVEPGAFPYDHMQLPFTQIGSIMRPGVPHYTSAVSFMRSPQMELNLFHAQMILIRKNFANPKWWIDDRMDLESDPDDSPNQILRGNSMNGSIKPEILQPSAMPPNDQGQWIVDELQDIVGLHEVSQAQVPGRVEAAKAIELLKEADDGRLAELLRTISSSISNGFYQQLRLVKQYGDPTIMVSTYSREGLPEVKKLFTEKLDPGLRVRVTMGTGLSRSRAAREDTLMLMWDNGIIQDRQLMAELMEMPISSVSPDSMFDLRIARNENYTMEDGKPVVPNSWDNHEIHKREHNNYRKTQEFLMAPVKIKNMFEFHVQMHDQLYVQQLGQQLQQQQLAAAVAQGAGFAQPAGGGAAPAAGGGAQDQTGSGGQQMPGTSAPVPNAMGASSPVDPFAVRNSPQGQVSYQDRFSHDLQKPVR